MRKLYSALAVMLCLLACGCAKEYKKDIFAMDTVMNLKIYAQDDEALAKSEAEIKQIDTSLNRGNKDSEIYKINNEKSAQLSDETAELIKTAVGVSEMTNGAFDITTAPLSNLWGFYGGHFRVPSDGEIASAIEGVGYNKIQLDGSHITLPENTSIDLGGIGKGYASDRVAEILKANKVKSAIISLGGNVYALGDRPDGKPWTVGITDPSDKSQLLGSVSVSGKAVVTSGGYQRFFEQDGVTYHHIIDPKTGKCSDSGLSSVTVIADSGTLSDGLSTALFVMGLDESARLWRENGGFEAVFADTNGMVYVTEGIAGSFHCDREYEIIK